MRSSRADGDPGSDVLVYQPLFVSTDAGASVPEQVMLSGLLSAASRSGFPIRVAILASRYDLGAGTGLWRKSRAYARFLGSSCRWPTGGGRLICCCASNGWRYRVL